MTKTKQLIALGLIVAAGLFLVAWGQASPAGRSRSGSAPVPATSPTTAQPAPAREVPPTPPGPAAPEPTVDAPSQPMVTTLALGDAAPPLFLQDWIKGEPVAAFEAGTVYLVDFFASWAAGAGEATRPLSRLQIGRAGRVRAIGIASGNEARGETREAVARFVERQGRAMAYGVAFDPHRLMFERFMTAIGHAGVPHTFVIDGQGRIAWHGHPLDAQLESIVDLVVRGEWGIDSYERLLDEQARADALMARAVEAWNAGERETTVDLLQEIFEIDPSRFGAHAVWKFHAIHVEMGESERAYAYARDVIEGPMRDSADPLADLAWVILEAPAERAYDDIVAEMAARRALEITDGQHAHAWGAVAQIESRRQNFDEALAAWEKAVGLARDESLESAYLQKQRETIAAREEALRGG